MALKLQRSYAYDTMPLTAAAPQRSKDAKPGSSSRAGHSNSSIVAPGSSYLQGSSSNGRPDSAYEWDSAGASSTSRPLQGSAIPKHASWNWWARQGSYAVTGSKPTPTPSEVIAAAREGLGNSLTSAPRELRYPCPLGCAAPSMLGWKVTTHVLEAHFEDHLLKWVAEEQLRAAIPPLLGHPHLGSGKWQGRA